MATITPFQKEAAAGGFSLQQSIACSGRLGRCDHTLLLKLVVHERLAPRLRGGEATASGVYDLAEQLRSLIASKPALLGPALSTNLDELDGICVNLLSLRDSNFADPKALSIATAAQSATERAKRTHQVCHEVKQVLEQGCV